MDDDVRSTAFYLAIWHAILTALVAILLIALHDLEPATALLIGANTALLFSLVLIVRANRLNEGRITRSELWRTLPARKRPSSEAGLRLARYALEDTWLQFAKAAAAIAVVLAGLAYASRSGDGTAWANAGRGPALAQSTSAIAGPAYRASFLAPMN
jgi:hypothetical protein